MRKLHGRLDVSFINKTFFPFDKHPKFINKGRCFLWAYLAYRLYSNLELWSMGTHAFVRDKVTNKFYDSETPDGTVDWKELPATKAGAGCGCEVCCRPARKFDIASKFRYTWRTSSEHFMIDYHKLNQKILNLIREQHEQIK